MGQQLPSDVQQGVSQAQQQAQAGAQEAGKYVEQAQKAGQSVQGNLPKPPSGARWSLNSW